MATNSKIEWTEQTWNPVTGCTRVSDGCDHCYASTMTARMDATGHEKYSGLTVLNQRGERHFNGKIKLHDDAMDIPLRRRKPTIYFVNSMSDLFHKDVPFEFIDKCFAVMALCPQHTFQILTKRPERMAEYLGDATLPGRIYRVVSDWLDAGESGILGKYWDKAHNISGWRTDGDPSEPEWIMPLPNIWIGTSCENQETADERIPHLLRVPAAVRFLSVEPLLDAVCLDAPQDGWLMEFTDEDMSSASRMRVPPIHWVIVGGESGPNARPCNVEWIRSIVKQCKAASVPCFVKQLGARPVDGTRMSMDHDRLPLNLSHPKGGDPSEWPEDLRVRQTPTAAERVTCDKGK